MLEGEGFQLSPQVAQQGTDIKTRQAVPYAHEGVSMPVCVDLVSVYNLYTETRYASLLMKVLT